MDTHKDARLAPKGREMMVRAVVDCGCRRRRRETAKQIAAEVGVPPATVSRIPRRLGLNRLSALERAEPVRGSWARPSWRTHPHQHQEARQIHPGR
jgi:hypothetical protein